MSELKGYGICKDCGAGTMSNDLNTQFELDGGSAVCVSCGSTHIDGELYLAMGDEDADGEQDEEQDEYGDPYSDEDYEREVGA